jgi:hypothetical protein
VAFDLKAVRIANCERRYRLAEFENGEMVHRSFYVANLALAGRLRLRPGDCNNKEQCPKSLHTGLLSAKNRKEKPRLAQ